MRRIYLAAPLMLGLSMAALPVHRAQAQLAIAITIAPPELPVYDQPPIPEYGYIWAPGYWAWSDAGYYWVPGTWVLPPEEGLLWTPGYWGYGDNGYYRWHVGYWGPHVGFYGGVNYGYGYGGNGYQGGYWQHDHFYYNRAANNFGNTHIDNVYERNVTYGGGNRISYNGGHGGIEARPNQQELGYQREHHFDPTSGQMQQEHAAAGNRQMWATSNHGVPPIAATSRPADFSGQDVRPAHNAPVNVQAPDQHAGQGMMAPPHQDQGMAPGAAMHPQNGMAPQHQDQGVAQGTPMHPQDGMSPQHPQGAMTPPGGMMAPQHENAMTPVRPGNAMAPRAAQPEAPAYHPQPMQQMQPMQPAMHAPQAPAYHPQDGGGGQMNRPQGGGEMGHPQGGGEQHPGGGEQRKPGG